MATISVGLNKKYVSKKHTGTFPLCLQISFNKDTRFIHLDDIRLSEAQWVIDKKGNYKIKDYPNAERRTSEVLEKYSKAKTFLINNKKLIDGLKISELTKLIAEKVVNKVEEELNDKSETTEESIVKLRSAYLGVYGKKLVDEFFDTNDPSDVKNARWYKDAISSFKKFNCEEDIQMIDITPGFLLGYKKHWLKKIYKKEAKINTLNARLRAIRAILNKARREGPPILAKSHKPFDDVEIPTQEANKRAMNADGINIIKNLILEEGSVEWHQYNYAFFMFNNQGMNFVDLANLKVHQISNGRLRYIRSKSKRSRNPKEFDIKLTEESNRILSYYIVGKKPGDYVFPILSKELENNALKLVNVRDEALKVHNETMKRLAKDNGLEDGPTTYVWRHSWANIAKQSGASTEKIKDALGQKNVIITETYLANFDNEVLDELNEMVTSLGASEKMKEKIKDLAWIQNLLVEANLSSDTANLKELIMGLILKGLSKEFSAVS